MHMFFSGAGSRSFARVAVFSALFTLLAGTAFAQRQMENLGRGVIAVRASATEAFVSWRVLGYEPQDLPFNLYRSADGGAPQKLNATPLESGTNFTDTTLDPTVSNAYFVRPVVNGSELAASASYTLPANAPVRPYFSLPLLATPWPTYVHLAWVGDLDGDGEFDFVVDRLPLQGGRPQLLDAYRRDGTFLWRVDFGANSIDPPNIEPNAAAISAGHNDGVTVYDLDSDGRAEVVVKSANGVTFGDGEMLTFGDNVTQFISVLDGLTGAERARAPVPTDYLADGPVSGHFGIAYLDGVNPSFVFKGKNRVGNGPFNVIVTTWDFDGANLVQRWKFAPGIDLDYPNFHQIRIVDVDRDGRDEICDGGYVLDDDGSVLYSLAPQGVIHGDRFHISDLNPDRPGLEGFGIQQNNASGLLYYIYDAATGALIHQHFGGIEDTARGTAADVSAAHRGYEYWSFHGIHEIKGGTVISPEPRRPWPNFRLWWDGDVLSENLNREIVEKWNPATGGTDRLLTASDDGALDSWRDAAQFNGDIFGDWREEVVWEKSDHTALLIYTTPIPTSTRLYTLAHNPAYRLCFTVKGYQQSNMLDYYLGDGMTPPPLPDLVPVIGDGANAPVIVAFTTDTGVDNNDRITSDNTPTLHGLAPSDAPLVVSRIGAGDDGAADADAAGVWSFGYASPLPDGQHYFLARVDDGGNEFSPPFAIRIDTTPPAQPAIEAVLSDGSGGWVIHGTAEPGMRVDVSVDGVGVIGATVADVDGRWSLAHDGAGLPGANQTFSAAAADIAGNASEPGERPVDLAAAHPTVIAVTDDTGVSNTDRITSDRTLVLSGTAAPGAAVSVYRLGTGTIGNVSAAGGGAWSFDYGSVSLADGDYAFTAFSGSSAGAPSFNVEIDGASPTVTAIDRIAPSTASSSSSTVIFRVIFTEPVTGLDPADFTLVLDGSLEGVIANIAPAGPASYDVTASPLSGEGTVRLDLSASGTGIADIAGNALSGGFATGEVFTRVLLGDGVWTRTASGGLWSDNANWLDGIVAHGAGATANFNTLEVPDDILVRLDAPHTVTNLLFGDQDLTSAASWTIDDNGSADSVLTLVSGTAAPSITINALGTGARVDIAAPLAGTSGFSKNGPGTLALSGPQSLGGTINVNSGALRVESGGELMPSGLNTSSSGTIFAVAGGVVESTGNASINSGSNLVVESGLASFPAINAGNQFGNVVRVEGGTLLANSISFQRSTDGSHNYNTGFIVRGGSAQVGTINLGTANSNAMMSVEGGTVEVTGPITLGNQSTGGRGGQMRVTGGVLNVSNSANGGLIVTRRHNNASSANFLGGVSTIERITLGFDGSVAGGSGTLNLNGGTLYVGAGGIVSNATGSFAANINLTSGVLGAHGDWSSSLPMSLPTGGNVTIKAADAADAAHQIVLTGVLSGAGGFTKTDGGQLTLGAANTFTGPVAVNGGVLQVDGAIAVSADPVEVNATGILSGGGTIQRAVTLHSGGTIMPGSAVPGSALTAAEVVWNSEGVLAFDLTETSNQLVVTDALTKAGDGPHAFVFNAGPDIAAGYVYTLVTFGSTDFAAADFSFDTLAPGLTGAFFVNAHEITFKVYGPPVILESPQDASVVFGGSTTFSVGVDESPTLAYQWFKDGQPIDGATEATLTIDDVQGYDIGSYHVVVTNDAGSTASAAAQLTIAPIALSRGALSLNSAFIDGSIQQLDAGNSVLNGDTVVSGDLLAAGLPQVVINGTPNYAGTIEGTGAETPLGYTITLNSRVTLGHVVRRSDPVALPAVRTAIAPTGTRSVSINQAGQSIGDWATLRNLTVNRNVGSITVPAGAYGAFGLNGGAGLTLGEPGAIEPSVYSFQQLTLNNNATIEVVGPVIMIVANGFNLNGGSLGSTEQTGWLTLHAHGDLSLNRGSIHGYVLAPAHQLTLNSRSEVVGGVAADRLTLNSGAALDLLVPEAE